MNVATLLTKARRAHGDRTAVRFASRELTYADLDAEAGCLAAAFLGRGLVRGDRVVIFMRNNAEYISALFACFRSGLVAVPVNARLHARELAYVLAHAECAAVVYDDEHESAVGDALAETERPLLVRVAAGRASSGEVAFRDLLAEAAPMADAPVDPDDLAWLFYTSGTTGSPKGAMLSHRNLTTMAVSALAEMHSFAADDVVFHVAPLSHGSGMYLLPAIAGGSANVVYDGATFEPEDVLSAAARTGTTVFAFLAPTMLVLLLDAAARVELPSIRKLLYGGAPIHTKHAREAIHRFGPVLCQLYGQGEAPMTITHLAVEEHSRCLDGDLVPAGIPFTAVDVRVVDEQDVEVPAGTLGEVVVHGDVVMLGYWRDPEASERALRGGWLHTGDIGRTDPQDGLLYLIDRRNDTIVSGGSNIYPREVEEALLLHPAVREACVFGVPDEVWGESVAAVVVLQPGSAETPGELVEHCRSYLASYKKPKHVLLVDEIPKNAAGKMLRPELRERFAAAAVLGGRPAC